MRGRTFALSQKELQRVSVISRCAKGDMACARAAALLALSVRQVKRLKKRLREHGEAALAHANRGQPSPRRLPERVRQTALRLARTTYAGFNDHHLCEKLCEVEGFSLSRETLRRLLRQAGLGSPRKRRAPAHRQRRLRSAREGELVQLDGSSHDWLEGRGPRLTALGLQDDATVKSSPLSSFPPNPPPAISPCSANCCVTAGSHSPSMAITAASSCATTTSGRWKNSSPESVSPPSSDAPWSNSASPSSPLAVPRPKAASNVSGAYSRIVCAASCAWLRLAIWTPPMPCSACSSPTTTAASPTDPAKCNPHGVPRPKIWTAFAALSIPA